MNFSRVVIKDRAIRKLLRSADVAEHIKELGNGIWLSTENAGSEARTDYTMGKQRPRVAIIAGYERGATRENTREALLSGLDGAKG